MCENLTKKVLGGKALGEVMMAWRQISKSPPENSLIPSVVKILSHPLEGSCSINTKICLPLWTFQLPELWKKKRALVMCRLLNLWYLVMLVRQTKTLVSNQFSSSPCSHLSSWPDLGLSLRARDTEPLPLSLNHLWETLPQNMKWGMLWEDVCYWSLASRYIGAYYRYIHAL